MLGNCSNEMKLVVRVPHGMQFRNQNNFRSSLRRKQFVLSLLSYEISEFNFFIHSFFHNARNLIKSNVIHSQSSSWHVVSKSKRISDLACVEKKFVLSLLSYEISKFIFSYIAFFIILGSCPIETKLIVRDSHGVQFLNQNEFPIQLAQKKCSISRYFRTK